MTQHRMSHHALKALAAALLVFGTGAHAQDANSVEATADSPLENRAQDVVGLFSGIGDPREIFHASFLTAVSPEQLSVISDQLIGQFGPIIGIDQNSQLSPTQAAITLRFEKALGTGTLNIAPEAPYRVTGFILSSFEPLDDNAQKVEADLAALPGGVSAYFGPLVEGEPLIAIASDQQFAIGSTFKLYILSALAHSIEQGERSWDDVIRLDRKSWPSGVMQDWPDGAPMTLHTAASMMISISDNTATDLLLRELGRDRVETELILSGHSAPDKTLPFLSTFEMFALKGSASRIEAYAAADEAGQARILAALEAEAGGDRDRVDPPDFVEPTAIDTLEWFASAEDLKRILRRIAKLNDPTARQIMAINLAMPEASAENWRYVGYKGGSEPGVLNLTWLLQDQDETWHMLSLSWNNPEAEVEQTTLELLAQRILALHQ